MAKKTARPAKGGQQRSKEEQWRKRMASQARMTAGAGAGAGAGSAVAEPDAAKYTDGSAEEGTYAPTQARSTSRTAGAGRAQSAAAAAAVRRAAMYSQRPGQRSRASVANSLSIDQEMHYVRSDIRRLVILTSVCIAVLLVLAFLVPSILR